MRELFAQGMEDLEAGIRWRPGHPVPYGHIAAILRAAGRADEGAVLLERMIEVDPRSYGARRRLIQAIDPRWGGNLEVAVQVAAEAQEFVDLNPRLRVLQGFVPAYLGEEAWRKRDYDLAIALYSKALEFGDFGAEWSWARARLYTIRGDYRAAARDANRMLEIAPNEGRSWAMRGDTRTRAGHPEAALEDIDRALELAPNYAWAWGRRGAALRALRRREEAVAAYTRAAELEPDETWALRMAGSTSLRELRQPEAALPHLEKANEVDPDDTGAWFLLGQAYAALGRPEAEAVFRRYVAGAQDDPGESVGLVAAKQFLSGGAEKTSGAQLRGLSLLQANAASEGEQP